MFRISRVVLVAALLVSGFPVSGEAAELWNSTIRGEAQKATQPITQPVTNFTNRATTDVKNSAVGGAVTGGLQTYAAGKSLVDGVKSGNALQAVGGALGLPSGLGKLGSLFGGGGSKGGGSVVLASKPSEAGPPPAKTAEARKKQEDMKKTADQIAANGSSSGGGATSAGSDTTSTWTTTYSSTDDPNFKPYVNPENDASEYRDYYDTCGESC